MPLLPTTPRPPKSSDSGTEPFPLPLTDDLKSPEEVADRARRRRRLLLIPLLLLVLAGLGLAARPALHAVKAWQARRIAVQAEKFIDQGKWIEAKGKVMDAIQIWQAEPTAMRAAARLLGRTGNPREATAFWTRLERVRPLTQDEEREFTQRLASSRDFALAEQHLRKAWPDKERGTVHDWELDLQILVGLGRMPEAVALARQIIAEPASTARQKFNAATVLLATNQTAIQGAGLKALVALADDTASPESLDALVILAQRARAQTDAPAVAASLTLPTLGELLERIEAHPEAKIQHHLLSADLRMTQDPTRRAAEIQQAMERFGDSKDDDTLTVFAGWLYSEGEIARVLEVISPTRANNDAHLFFQRLDALAGLGRWAEVRQAIQERKVVVEPVVEQMYLARCAEELHEPRVRDARWDAALDAAAGMPEKLMQVGTYARKTGNLDVAIRAFAATAAAAPDSREAATALAGAYQASGDTVKTHETLDALARRWPDDPAIRNDRAYLDALLGENLTAARNTARELMHADPSSLPHRVTLALAELRLGHDLGAMDAFRGVDPAVAPMQPSQRAVFAAALWAASYNGQARDQARGISLAQLLPEERVLLEPILNSDPQKASSVKEEGGAGKNL